MCTDNKAQMRVKVKGSSVIGGRVQLICFHVDKSNRRRCNIFTWFEGMDKIEILGETNRQMEKLNLDLSDKNFYVCSCSNENKTHIYTSARILLKC